MDRCPTWRPQSANAAAWLPPAYWPAPQHSLTRAQCSIAVRYLTDTSAFCRPDAPRLPCLDIIRGVSSVQPKLWWAGIGMVRHGCAAVPRFQGQKISRSDNPGCGPLSPIVNPCSALSTAHLHLVASPSRLARQSGAATDPPVRVAPRQTVERFHLSLTTSFTLARWLHGIKRWHAYVWLWCYGHKQDIRTSYS